jgi:predicted Ser/Thr protein kinase
MGNTHSGKPRKSLEKPGRFSSLRNRCKNGPQVITDDIKFAVFESIAGQRN